jgi:hypothetical protein
LRAVVSQRSDMRILGPALVRLYPPRWRRRYGAELQELLGSSSLSLRTIVDVLAGAVDAHIHPQPRQVTASPMEEPMKSVLFRCAPVSFTRQEQWRSAAWMLGGSLVMTALALGLKIAAGSNSATDALLYGAFPASLMLANESTYFRRYSRGARLILAVGGALVVLLMMWASVIIANAI